MAPVAVQVEGPAQEHDAPVAHGVDVLALDLIGQRDRRLARVGPRLGTDLQLAAAPQSRNSVDARGRGPHRDAGAAGRFVDVGADVDGRVGALHRDRFFRVGAVQFLRRQQYLYIDNGVLRTIQSPE